MIARLSALALLCSATGAVGNSDDPFAAADAVSDAELAGMRGGFTLPNGIDVALTVQIDTVVDGALILRTVFAADTGPARLAVYAPAPGHTVPASHSTTGGNGNAPLVSLSLAGGTLSLPAGARQTPVSMAGAAGDDNFGAAVPGLAPLPITVGGPGVQTAGGIVSLAAQPVGVRVLLSGSELDIVNLVGQAFGTVVANTGNNRTISTMTTIDLELRGAEGLSIGTSALRGQDLALDAVSRMRF